jgi:hypothetical protein
VLPVFLAAACAAPVPGEADVAGFLRLLHAVELGADEIRLAACARELAALQGAVELHLATTLERRLPAHGEYAQRPLSPEHHALLERALPELERGEVVAVVERGLAAGGDAAWRAAALELLGHAGAAEDLRLLVRLTGDARTGDALLEEFEAAAERLFRRRPDALEALEGLSMVPDPAALELIDVVGVCCPPTAVPWLLEQLDDDDFSDRALGALARIAPSVPIESAPELAAALRTYLGSEAARTRRLAMGVLAGLQDEASIPRLVELLSSTETGEAREAARTLRRLSGIELPDDPAAWTSWLAGELQWWGTRGEAALAALSSEDAREALAAVSEVSARGLSRDRIARELARVLREHELSQVREKAGLGLVRLRSRAAVPELVAALEGADRDTADLAWRTLQALTGLAHPMDARAWRDALARG